MVRVSQDSDYNLSAATDGNREDRDAFKVAKCAKAIMHERMGPPPLGSLRWKSTTPGGQQLLSAADTWIAACSQQRQHCL
jgi:hypothetical protein